MAQETGLPPKVLKNSMPVWNLEAISGVQATAATGFQPNPGVGRDARGNQSPALNIAAIVRACGVGSIFIVRDDEGEDKVRAAFRAALGRRELALVIVRMDHDRPD